MHIDPLVDTFADVMEVLTKIVFATSDEDKKAAVGKFGELAKKVHKVAEASLQQHGGRYIAGDAITIGDFVMASYASHYVLDP